MTVGAAIVFPVVVRKVSEEIRSVGRTGERDQSESFAFWDGVWWILVMRWERYALDAAIITQ